VRLNLLLLVLVVVCAVGAVASQHRARRLFNELEREQERMRGSVDRDRQVEQEDVESEYNRESDEAVRGGPTDDVDPDSPDWDGDRDDFGNA